MACYLLLRNNQETGPFTRDELRAQQLKPQDLIWIEGQSSVWKHPNELEGFNGVVSKAPAVLISSNTTWITDTSRGVFVAFPAQPPFQTQAITPADVEANSDVQSDRGYFRNTFSNPHNALWIGCVFAGLLFSAVLVKDIVDMYKAHADGFTVAALSAPDRDKSLPEEDLYQNALTTELLPIDTVTMQPVNKAPNVNLKKLVQLVANDYRVGLVGGIKNLRMLVINKSAFVLRTVTFELQYLKPNGDVLKTEKLTVRSVNPKSCKGVAVAFKNRGVKIAYHILDIQPKQNSSVLVNL